MVTGQAKHPAHLMSNSDTNPPSPPHPSITLRRPTADDGASLHALVASCPPLDTNSLYCNLLHCTHFADTSVAAVAGGDNERLVGFISAYRPPRQPDTLFVWQVAVADEARKQGLAGRMLDALLARPACADVRFVETTIGPDNAASWGLFESWARRRDAATQRRPHFDAKRHFGGSHDDELLMQIGPLAQAAEIPT